MTPIIKQLTRFKISCVKDAQQAVSPAENKLNCVAFASSPTVGRAYLSFNLRLLGGGEAFHPTARVWSPLVCNRDYYN